MFVAVPEEVALAVLRGGTLITPASYVARRCVHADDFEEEPEASSDTDEVDQLVGAVEVCKRSSEEYYSRGATGENSRDNQTHLFQIQCARLEFELQS